MFEYQNNIFVCRRSNLIFEVRSMGIILLTWTLSIIVLIMATSYTFNLIETIDSINITLKHDWDERALFPKFWDCVQQLNECCGYDEQNTWSTADLPMSCCKYLDSKNECLLYNSFNQTCLVAYLHSAKHIIGNMIIVSFCISFIGILITTLYYLVLFSCI